VMLAKGILPTAFFACILKIFRKYRESLPSLACSADDTVLWIASSSVFHRISALLAGVVSRDGAPHWVRKFEACSGPEDPL